MASPAAPAATPQSERGKTEVDAAANGADLTPQEEHDALYFLLGPRRTIDHGVTVQYETPEGVKALKFVIRAQDGRQLDRIEQSNVNDTTGRVDQTTANCQIVGLATVAIVDVNSGATIDPKSERFRTVHPEQPPLASPADAIEARFREQVGLIYGVAREVRRVSGFDPEKVGNAERLVDPSPKYEAAAGK